MEGFLGERSQQLHLHSLVNSPKESKSDLLLPFRRHWIIIFSYQWGNWTDAAIVKIDQPLTNTMSIISGEMDGKSCDSSCEEGLNSGNRQHIKLEILSSSNETDLIEDEERDVEPTESVPVTQGVNKDRVFPGISWPSTWADGSRRSAFQPYKVRQDMLCYLFVARPKVILLCNRCEDFHHESSPLMHSSYIYVI